MRSRCEFESFGAACRQLQIPDALQRSQCRRPLRWFSIKDLTSATAPLSNEVSTSSSSQSFVLQTSSRASATRRRWPSDKSRAGSDSRPARPICPRASRARSLLTDNAIQSIRDSQIFNRAQLVFYSVTMTRGKSRAATYSSPSERIFAPSQLIWPSAGGRSPHRIRSKLVLPLPFGPVSWTNVPGDTAESSPLKSLRSPRTHPSLLTSNMFVVPPGRDCNGLSRIAFSASLRSRFDGTVRSQPFLPTTLQHFHAFESAGLQNLRCGDARFIFRTSAVSDDLSILRQIFEWWISETRLQLSNFKVNRAFNRGACWRA